MAASIADILSPECTKLDVVVADREAVLRFVGDLLSRRGAEGTSAEIYEGFLARESLGSTGIGDGIAIPHCRLARCEGSYGALVRLREPVDFDAIDDGPVDLIFALMGPERDVELHLEVLASLARRFNQPGYRTALRAAKNEKALYEVAVGSVG